MSPGEVTISLASPRISSTSGLPTLKSHNNNSTFYIYIYRKILFIISNNNNDNINNSANRTTGWSAVLSIHLEELLDHPLHVLTRVWLTIGSQTLHLVGADFSCPVASNSIILLVLGT